MIVPEHLQWQACPVCTGLARVTRWSEKKKKTILVLCPVCKGHGVINRASGKAPKSE